MSCLGVLFSLDAETVGKLKSFKSDENRLEYLQEEIEEKHFSEFPDKVAELDKSWDALHRCLTDGKLEYYNGEFPLSHVILGGETLYFENDYIMTLKTPDQVKQIAESLNSIDKEYIKNGYGKIDEKDYGLPLSEEDFEYTWTWFDESKKFWNMAGEENRYVLFTADQ